MTSERKIDRSQKDKSQNPLDSEVKYNDIRDRPSTDFAALIDAIKNEGRANREEEQVEERGKKIRESLTIRILVLTLIVLAVTCCAIIEQVAEMQKVYTPISIETKTAVDTERRQLGAFITVNDAKVIETRNDDKELVHATLIPIVENTGQTPAREVVYRLGYSSATGHDNDLSLNHPPEGSNVFGLTPLNGTRLSIGPRSKEDRTLSSLGIGQPALDMLRDQKMIIYLFGSISYKDVFGACHVTNFCFVIGKRPAVPNELGRGFCDGGTNCTDEECGRFTKC